MRSTPPILLALRSANGPAELLQAARDAGLHAALDQPLPELWGQGGLSEHAAAAIRGVVPNPELVRIGDFLGDRDCQRELKKRTAYEVRRDVLRAVRTVLESNPSRGAAEGRPTTRTGIVAWATQAGIAERLYAPIEELASFTGRSAVGALATHRRAASVIDILSPLEFSPRHDLPRQRLVPTAWKWLEAEAAAVRQALTTESARLQTPQLAHPVLVEVFELLASGRRRLRESHPPAADDHIADAEVEFQADPPRLIVKDPRSMVQGWRISHPNVTLNLERWREGELRGQCTFCPRESACTHRLLAVDAVLGWLGRLPEYAQADIAEALSVRSWERALGQLRRTLGPPDEEVVPEGDDAEGTAQRVAWRIDLKKSELRVKAVLRRPLRKGGWSAGTALGPDLIDRGFIRHCLPQDRRAAAFLSSGRYDVGGEHVWHALASLEGHPDVAFTSAPDQPVRVAEVELGLVCVNEPGGGFRIQPSVEGEPVELSALVALRGTYPRYLHADPGRRACFLVKARNEVAQALGVLSKRGGVFPEEAAEALGRELWDLRVPVSLPARLLGTEVDPNPAPLLVALLEGLSLSVEAQVRPLSGGLAFPVGEGPAQVRGEEDGRKVFAQRRFEDERRRAEATFRELKLPLPEPGQSVRATAEGVEAIAWLRRLEEAAQGGLEVLWPPRRPAITRPIGAKDLKVTVRPARDWFGVEGTAQVDEERVRLAVMLEAARKKQRFVQLSENAWAELSDELLQSLAPLAELTVEANGATEVSVAAAPALEKLSAEVGEFDGAPRLSELLERMKSAASITPQLPAGLKAELRPYQREGFEWLSRLSRWAPGACLADDMGLGKTLQALAVLLERSAQGPQLVVAPTSVCFNWEKEAEKFAPGLKVHAWRTADREQLAKALGPGDVLVVSYGLLTRDVEKLKQIPFATVVFDEAQAVKNSGALRSRAARELQAEFRLALSGTPLENHLGELWSLFRVIFPGLLGTESQFRERFQGPIERNRDPERRKALAGIVRPFLLRRTKGQVATELPARTEVVVPVTLTAAEQTLYDDARLAAVAELEGAGGGAPEQRRFQVLAALTRLRLLACHPRLHDHAWTGPASKLARLLELVRELRAEGHRALVFSQFTKHLALVREALEREGVRLQYLDGETPERERRRRVEAFQEGSGEVFLISLKAGGTGLNLTGADYVIHLDPWWNPAVEDQATDRAHRIGQTKPVTVFRLVTQGTVEEQILALHGDKRALLSGVLEGTSEPGRFEVDELVALLREAQRGSPAEAAEEPDAGPEADSGPGAEVEPVAVSSERADRGAEPADTLADAVDAFREWLQSEHEQRRIGKGPVTNYPRSVQRFLRFVSDQGLSPEPGEELEKVLGEYLAALGSGKFEAPASEVVVGRAAVRKFNAFLQASALKRRSA